MLGCIIIARPGKKKQYAGISRGNTKILIFWLNPHMSNSIACDPIFDFLKVVVELESFGEIVYSQSQEPHWNLDKPERRGGDVLCASFQLRVGLYTIQFEIVMFSFEEQKL